MSSKRRKVVANMQSRVDIDDGVANPYNLQPMGNLLFNANSAPSRRESGLGMLAILSDQEILLFLEGFFTPRDALRLALVSKFLYVCVNDEQLWRAWTIQEFGGKFEWKLTWQQTYRHRVGIATSNRPLANLDGIYSDDLFSAFVSGASVFDQRWLDGNNVPRRHVSTFSVKEFKEQFELPNRPVIIEGILDNWPAFKKWNRQYIIDSYGQNTVHARGIDTPATNFFHYAETTHDDFPLYIFDKRFARKAPALRADYEVPEYFRDDVLQLLPSEARPDNAWLLIGPKRSGSTWHKDPNCTNAFNACIVGEKKWMLLPPHVMPPGIFCDENEEEVTVPLSLTDWFMSHFLETRRMGASEALCKPGDVIFVPHQWWHTVLNVSMSYAVTQNYLAPSGVSEALKWFDKRPSHVSGTALDGKQLAKLLRERIAAERPELNAAAAPKRSLFESSSSSSSSSTAFSFRFTDPTRK